MINFFKKKQKPISVNTTDLPPVTFYDSEYKLHYEYLGKKSKEQK